MQIVTIDNDSYNDHYRTYKKLLQQFQILESAAKDMPNEYNGIEVATNSNVSFKITYLDNIISFTLTSCMGTNMHGRPALKGRVLVTKDSVSLIDRDAINLGIFEFDNNGFTDMRFEDSEQCAYLSQHSYYVIDTFIYLAIQSPYTFNN